MKRRVRVHSARTQRFTKYLKPGELAQLRDSRINARSQVPNWTRRVDSLTRSVSTQEVFPSAQIEFEFEFLPEFPSLERGPQCFGRKKLVAAKNADPLISLTGNYSNLLVH